MSDKKREEQDYQGKHRAEDRTASDLPKRGENIRYDNWITQRKEKK